jgi:hypothetical protein
MQCLSTRRGKFISGIEDLGVPALPNIPSNRGANSVLGVIGKYRIPKIFNGAGVSF